MSKTIAQLAKLLSASNEQLYDRYINFRLMRERPEGPNDVNEDDFQVVCPRTGLKPDITVSASFHVQNTSNLVTLTVLNMNANIDTMAYNWAEIDVGYYNSNIHASFIGQITNCYMAKPNPNGELVVSVVCADIAAMYTKGDFEVHFTDDFVSTKTLVSTCLEAITTKYSDLVYISKNLAATLPGDWAKQSFLVSQGTYGFRSPLACIAWLNSLFASYTHNTGFSRGAGGAKGTFDVSTDKLDLPPLRLGFDAQGVLQFTATYSEAFPGTTKALSCIGSAYLIGEAATVTAPFNPDINPGDVIYVDPFYFKTRVNVEGMRETFDALGNLWSVIENKFTFSTRTTNTMTLTLNNIGNKVTSGEG